ncbi:BA75_03351T0 [Komagataella pastoris]|uniref:BA75_03351T0 n=1 Tax=Komagataella pastoris TaxID=4922 RepID=A0A1B2JFC4_PICPA|nr:BA75_03351T0 [Komagataella pastoris]
MSTATRQEKRHWVLGLLCLSIVVVFWVLSSFLVDELFLNHSYSKPFLLTYFNTGLFTIYLTPTLVNKLRQNSTQQRFQTSVINRVEERRLSVKETTVLSLQFCLLWYLSNLVTNASLKYTTVANQTILSSTSGFFTLLIGWLFRIENPSLIKMVGLGLSFVGIVMVTCRAQITNEARTSSFLSMFGNLLALAGALCYGLYTILLKRKAKNESRINTSQFFGFVGAFTLLLLWPLIIILNYLDIEPFELPKTKDVWCIIITNGCLTMVSDYLWAKALLLTSPLTVTVGLSFTIPFAIFLQEVKQAQEMSPLYLCGASLILISFILVNRDEKRDVMESALEA